jgi:selenium metabolism protein YedF
MSEVTLDCKGLPCPEPVLACKKAVESRPRSLTVLVDNEAARENVARFLTSQGYTVSWTPTAGAMTLTATLAGEAAAGAVAGGTAGPDCACVAMSEGEMERLGRRTVVFLTAETIGQGDDVLGGKLMFNFLGTLPEMGPALWRVILVNGAVKMATAGHPCLEKLKALEAGGVSLLVCGTCLDFFGLLEKKEAGQTTNMLDVVTSLDFADKVVSL